MPTPIGSLFTGTLQTNPTTATVLVTTGDLPSGHYELQFIVVSSAASFYNLEILDAADSILQTILLRVAANNSVSLSMNGAIRLNTDYEVRVRPQANITGNVAASILACSVAP